MIARRRPRPLALVIAGLLGISLFLIGDHYHWPIIPAGDFARGLWFGVCLGLEVHAVIVFLKSRTRPRPAS